MDNRNNNKGRPPKPENERSKLCPFWLPPATRQKLKALAPIYGSQAKAVIAAVNALRFPQTN